MLLRSILSGLSWKSVVPSITYCLFCGGLLVLRQRALVAQEGYPTKTLISRSKGVTIPFYLGRLGAGSSFGDLAQPLATDWVAQAAL